MTLPALMVPSDFLDQKPNECSTSFSIKNLFDELIMLKIEVDVISILLTIIELKILQRRSNTQIDSITVSPNESVDLRIVLSFKKKCKINKKNNGRAFFIHL